MPLLLAVLSRRGRRFDRYFYDRARVIVAQPSMTFLLSLQRQSCKRTCKRRTPLLQQMGRLSRHRCC